MILQLLRMIAARWAIVAVIMVSALATATLAVMILPRSYAGTARMLLLLDRPDPETGQIMPWRLVEPFVSTQIVLMRSGTITQRAAAIMTADLPSNTPGLVEKRLALAQWIQGKSNIELVPGAAMLEITIVSNDARYSAEAAGALRQAYLESMVDDRRKTALQNLKWLRARADALMAEVNQAEQRRRAFEQANNVVLLDQNANMEANQLKSLIGRSVMAAANRPRIDNAAAARVNSATAQLARVDAAIAVASMSLGPNHPQIAQMRAQREVLATARNAELARVATLTPEPNFASRISAQTSRILAERGKLDEGRRLADNVLVLLSSAREIAENIQRFSQLARSNQGMIRAVDPPILKPEPVAPRVSVILPVVGILGLILGVMIALLVELLARRVRTTTDLDTCGAPLIGITNRPLPLKAA